MSDEEESNVNSEQEEDDDEENDDEDNQDQDDQDQDEDGEDEDQDGSGDDDEEGEDGSGEDGDQDQEAEDDEQNQSKEEDIKKLPTFNIPQRQPPTEFTFTSLLSQISNLSSSVDNFIGSLHSSTASRRPYSNYAVQQTSYQPRLSQIKVPEPPAQSRIVIMKDEDTQVDMKPQIIIQPTKPVQQDPVIQAKPYKIATQSQKFLAQLYEENKRLKRWQTNPTHPMASYMTSYSGSNGFGASGNGFYGSREKFERKEYEKGLFNVDERNKEIDEAIMMLKREEQEDY